MSKATVNNLSHLFYIEPNANEYLPQWFLELTTREDAEQMLSSSTGSVLMRSHPSFQRTGKYVITYRKGTDCFKHYLLLNTPDGFRLELEHKDNRPVNCLSEAMDLFVKLVGRSAQRINCCRGSSPDYVNVNGGNTVENTMKTNISSTVSRNVGSSTGSLQPSPYYINTPQSPHASTTRQLSKNVPSSPEALSSVHPIHIYLNAPQISNASSTSKFCPEESKREQHIMKEPRGYVNMQQLSLTAEETSVEGANSRSRPTTGDDFPSNVAPPPPQQN